MKFKGLMITGFLLILVGVVAILCAAARNDFDDVIKGDVEVEELVFETTDITTIKFDADADDVLIKKSTDGKIKLMNKSCESYTYIVTKDQNNVLNISQDMKDGVRFDFGAIFNFSHVKYELYIPEGIGLVDVKIDAGNLEIENINVGTLNVNLSAGNFEMENSTIGTSIIDVDAGNADINKTTFKTVSTSIDMGNLDAEVNVSESGEFGVDVGNIDVTLVGDSSLYNVNNQNQSGTIAITINVDMGNRDINYKSSF